MSLEKARAARTVVMLTMVLSIETTPFRQMNYKNSGTLGGLIIQSPFSQGINSTHVGGD